MTVKRNTPEARRGGQGSGGSGVMPRLHRYTQHYSHLKDRTRQPPLRWGEDGTLNRNQPVFTADGRFHDDPAQKPVAQERERHTLQRAGA